MDKIEVRFDCRPEEVRPGANVSVTVSWQVSELSRKQKKVEVFLCWETSGRGTTDKETVESIEVEVAERLYGSEKVEFTMPVGPRSFEGRLISLQWELQAWLGDLSDKVHFVLSEDGNVVNLPTAEYKGLKGPKLNR